MRRFAILLVALGLVVTAAPASAQSAISITLEGIFEGAEGEVVQVHEEPVDTADVGSLCTGTLVTDNNGSVHPDNVLIISSGDATAEIPGIEDEAGLTLNFDGTLVLGDTITVSIRFGPDEITSLGMNLTLDCTPPATTTTTTVAPTTTTTEAAAAPVGPVETGAGGTAPAAADQTGAVVLGVTGVLFAVAVGAFGWRRRAALR